LRLGQQPRIGNPVNSRNGYRYPVPRYGISIFYRHRPRKRQVEIVRLVRGSRVKKL
jgi:plasmid stabilization system protein ParE